MGSFAKYLPATVVLRRRESERIDDEEQRPPKVLPARPSTAAMGRVQHGSRTKGSKKDLGKTQKTKRYQRDLDQIQLDLLDGSRRKRMESTVPLPEDTPGFGAYPCVACDRHFISSEALKTHSATKPHKKRLKELKEAPFTQAEADAAAGRGVDNRQKPATMPGPALDTSMVTMS